MSTRQTADEILAAIAEIDSTLNAGVQSVTVDGITTNVDLEFLRRRRAELERQLAAIQSGDDDDATPPRFRPVQL